MEITATYDDDSTAVITGYTYDKTPLTEGATSVKITYKEKDTTVAVTVSERKSVRKEVEDFTSKHTDSGKENSQLTVLADNKWSGGKAIGYIYKGNYLVYNDVNFDVGAEVTRFTMHYSSGNGLKFTVRLDKADAEPIAEINLAKMSNPGMATFELKAPATGTHMVYLCFVSGGGDLDWFEFSN